MTERFNQALSTLKNTDWAASVDDAAQSVLEEYVFSASHMSGKNFELFCNVFAKYIVHNSGSDFYPAEIALSRHSHETLLNQPELFDEINQQLFKGDTSGIIQLIRTIGDSCSRTACLPTNLGNKLSDFFSKQVWHHSFSRQDIQLVQKSLTTEYPNVQLSRIFHTLSANIESIKKQKIKRDINQLNDWAFRFESNDLLKKLSFRNTYINLAYELLVREHDIKNIFPEKYYQNHRQIIQKKIKELTGTFDCKGKQICRKYALNKVYKSTATQDTFKLESVIHALDHYQNEIFFDDCKTILTALEGGRKYREVKIPYKILSQNQLQK